MGDLEFIQRCVKGDKLALDEFLKTYSRLIYNYIISVLNAKGFAFRQDNVQDIFQEIFYSLIKDNFRKLRSFKARNGCSLASWLRQVTVNFTIGYTRRIKPAVSLDEETGEGFAIKDTLAGDAPGACDTIMEKERLAQLKDCINRLNTDDKFFVDLHINRGLNLEVLRGIFKVSRGAIDMRKSRIIDRLRDCFRSKGFKLDF